MYKNACDPIKLGSKKDEVQKKYQVQIGPKFLFDPYLFVTYNIFGSTKWFVSKKLGSKKLGVQKILGSKNIDCAKENWVQKELG